MVNYIFNIMQNILRKKYFDMVSESKVIIIEVRCSWCKVPCGEVFSFGNEDNIFSGISIEKGIKSPVIHPFY